MKIFANLVLQFISSFALAQVDSDYVCKFVAPLEKVNAKEWKIKITGNPGDGSACVGPQKSEVPVEFP